MSKKTIFITILFLVSNATIAMDEPVSEKPGILLQDNDVVFDLVFKYYQDHNDICSFAETNKANHHRILATAHDRKNLLPKYTLPDASLARLTHKYGTACYHVDKRLTSDQIELRCEMFDSNSTTKINRSVKYFPQFITPLPHKPSPFFDKEGIFCFYGVGIINIPHPGFISMYKPSIQIVRYDLQGETLQCVMGVEDRKYDLIFCIDYPVLLQAILNSKTVTRKYRTVTRQMYTIASFAVKCLEYSLDGVTLPENYAEKVPFTWPADKDWDTTIYSDMSADIKDILAKHYGEQRKS